MVSHLLSLQIWISVLKPWVEADWGDWGPWQECAPRHHVMGVQLRIERWSVAPWHDNTALNAVRLTCSDGEVLVSEEGPWGDWRDVVRTEDRIVTVWLRAQTPRPLGMKSLHLHQISNKLAI